MIEFTGERVIPGQVDADLWSEHLARYAFARRHAAGKIVLDAGCGSGYGAADLAHSAKAVVGIDLSPEAAQFAASTYPVSNLHFAAASCETLPFPTAAFDLVTAFEVIEHLPQYRAFVTEAARVVKPDGLFIVSTPNKRYYAESRAATGPNPYHEHEFEAEEFECELRKAFPHVCLLVQNRVESFAFYKVRSFWEADARIDRSGGSVEDAHFFVALCSHQPLPELRSFVYVPKAANVLREREQHISLLNKQLAEVSTERDHLLELFRKQNLELEEHNRWADELNRQLGKVNTRVGELQDELVQMAAGYNGKIRELEQENVAKTNWARDTEERLTGELGRLTVDLSECVRLLDLAESTVAERTRWAQSAEAKRQELAAILDSVRSSRWVKLGRRVGLGPDVLEP